MTEDINLLPTEFDDLDTGLESYLNKDTESVEALETITNDKTTSTPPDLVKEVVEAPDTIKKVKKLVPAGWSGLRHRIIRKVLKKAGIEELLPIGDLFRNKTGTWVKINEISLFTSAQDDELMSELAQECCPELNRVCCSEIIVRRMVEIGVQILSSRGMCTPIHIIQVEDKLECVSGRHRLAFLALVYGAGCKVPVYLESGTLEEARKAVAVANESRPVKALEKAQHAALSVTGGDVCVNQDELYQKIAKNKNNIKKYCVYSVIKRSYPTPLDFNVSMTPTLGNGDLTTVSHMGSYWGAALDWRKGQLREDFDRTLELSTCFLNILSHMLRNYPEFTPKKHMSVSVLTAVGKYYNKYMDADGIDMVAGIDVWGDEYLEGIVGAIMVSREMGIEDTEEIYQNLVKVFVHDI